MESFMEIINDPHKVYAKIRSSKGLQQANAYAKKAGLKDKFHKSSKWTAQKIMVVNYSIRSVYADRIVVFNNKTNKCVVIFSKNYPELVGNAFVGAGSRDNVL